MINIKMEEQLEKEGKILTLPVGDSMMPILRYRQDAMLIEKLSREPKINDAVLYKRDSGQYVMHRIIAIKKDGYAIRGDNRYNIEYGVRRDQILGIMSGFYRGEKFIDCEKNKGYKAYVFLMRVTLIPRHIIFFIKKAYRKILKG
ncbi:MAG: S26 family signal peptidase [Oscillospiraceae bacterium]|nr:S26 family signal peptidase [Oscillospiraceae bacterium]